MEYDDTLRIAGATVHCYKTFGDYQGTWLAKVTYNGVTGWIRDYFGSCSGCDALQDEFGYSDHQHEGKGYNYISTFNLLEKYDANCPQCVRLMEKVKAFGRGYLDDIKTADEILAIVSKNLEWDMDAQKMVDFIKKNEIAL